MKKHSFLLFLLIPGALFSGEPEPGFHNDPEFLKLLASLQPVESVEKGEGGAAMEQDPGAVDPSFMVNHVLKPTIPLAALKDEERKKDCGVMRTRRKISQTYKSIVPDSLDYECEREDCNQRFPTLACKRGHLRFFHEENILHKGRSAKDEDREYKCPLCGTKFTSRSALRRHSKKIWIPIK